ncbi:CBS domain-containing protein [Desulfofundulus thermobenzoicus]|uniref:CBS domain-containing protein n=1 Tax=Desulfofundulus thermobenzoicus TaxID=29376 RepID=A0A6N7IMX4_9FIRM|nr:CBS domain-containing protein [Desulfofundulus thermobenzoicus]MQL50957.1 CBS domain-containing protein [Desulfofundulus thermobenzoicus]HHW42873.1 CBS domain-containing protein [Desulfotomaculum sp.]
MTEGRKVREVMIPIHDYSTVRWDAPLKEAVEILRSSLHREGRVWYGFHSIAVLDGNQHLVGLLTLRSLLKTLQFHAISRDAWLKGSSWGWYFAHRYHRQAGIRVKDIMRPLALATIQADDTVFQAAVKMITHRVNSLPVLEKRKVVGMVRTIDVFNLIGELLAG